MFLFHSKSSASPNTTTRAKNIGKCGEYYNRAFKDECYFKLIEALVDSKIIDEVFIFYESNNDPGVAKWTSNKKIYCEVIPEIRFISDYITSDTVILSRGGAKHWHDFLLAYKGSNWLIEYGANTGREKWLFWDIILDDIGENTNIVDKHGRYIAKFVKPTNEDIFKPVELPLAYDFCIGASHIHDKKGQYRIIDILAEYEKMFKTTPRVIIPGSVRRSANTIAMIPKILNFKNLVIPGFVTKDALNTIFNKSRFFVHLGSHGQNDRSLLEALASGTPIVYGSAKHHAPELKKFCFSIEGIRSSRELALHFKTLLELDTIQLRSRFYDSYIKHYGFNQVATPLFSRLIDFVFSAKPNINSKQLLVEVTQ